MKFGQFQGRIEDGRLVTGRGSYVGDLTLDGMVHAALARAPMPGAIAGLDVSAAREAPGVLGVWTQADLAVAGEPTHMPCPIKLPMLNSAPVFRPCARCSPRARPGSPARAWPLSSPRPALWRARRPSWWRSTSTTSKS